MQAGALKFLKDLAPYSQGNAKMQITSAIDKALNMLIVGQNKDGGWPLVPGASNYRGISAINDNVTPSHITILFEAWSQDHDGKLLRSAQRGLEFLLSTQLSSGAWAQQYSADGWPAKARKFEPVAASSLETAYAMRALLDAYFRTYDTRLLKSAEKGAQWLKSIAIGPQEWARLYEIGSSRPVFGDRDGSVHYSLDEISPERQAGYRWKGRFIEVEEAIDLLDVALAGDSAAFHAREQDLSLVHELSLMAIKVDPDPIVPISDTKHWLDLFYRQIGRVRFSQ